MPGLSLLLARLKWMLRLRTTSGASAKETLCMLITGEEERAGTLEGSLTTAATENGRQIGDLLEGTRD